MNQYETQRQSDDESGQKGDLKMKLSFLTYLFQRYPLQEAFARGAEIGFEGIEIWGARPHAYCWDMDESALNDIRSWSREYGLAVSMYVPEIIAYPYSLVSRLKKEREDTAAYLVRSLECAAEMGTDKMQITAPHPGYGRNREEVWEQLIEGLSVVAKRAEELGVNMVLEHLSYSEGGNVLDTCDNICRAISEVGSPALVSMIDVVPPFLANEPYAEYFEKLGGRLQYLHLCNNDGVTEVHDPLDQGVIPLQEFFCTVRRFGYNGWSSIELLAPYFRDPEMYLRHSYTVLCDLLEEAGIARG